MNIKPNRTCLVIMCFALFSIRVECSVVGDIGSDQDTPDRSVLETKNTVAQPVDEIPDEVTVKERRLDFGASESNSAIKSGAALRELPLSVEVLRKEIIENSQHHNFANLLDGFTLSNSSPGERGLYEEIVLRGFTEAPFYRDGLNDSLGVLPVRDLSNVESIEVLKGPNSALYGQGEPGGSINFQTKQPRLESFNSVTVGLGSYDRYRVEIDSTGPLARDRGLAYRLVGAIENSNSFRDFVKAERTFAAPSLSWKPNERLEFLGSLEFIRHVAPFDSGVLAVEGSFPLPRGRFLGEPDIGNTGIEALTSTLSGDYEFSDAWKVSSTLYWQDTEIHGLKVEPSDLDDLNAAGPSAILSRELQNESIRSEIFSAQVELEGEFDIRGVENRVLVGYEYSSIKDFEDIQASDSEEEPYEIDIFDVAYGQERPSLAPLIAARESVDVHSLYLQDFVKFGEHWRLLAGTRLDVIDTTGRDLVSVLSFVQEDRDFSSRLGIVYSPNSSLSLFTSFSESLDPNEGLNPSREPLQPTRGRAFEGGIKFRYPVMDLSLDTSAFRIEQTNVTSDAPNAPGFEIQTARQVSRGLDLELLLKPGEWIQLGVKYGYTDAEISDDPEIPGGTVPINAPLHKLVVFGLFSFNLTREHDLQTGVNFVYMSERQASLDEDELSVRLPGYSTVNLFIDYAFSPHVDFGMDISNVLDEDYLSGSQSDLLHITPGAPITVFGTIKIHF